MEPEIKNAGLIFQVNKSINVTSRIVITTGKVDGGRKSILSKQ